MTETSSTKVPVSLEEFRAGRDPHRHAHREHVQTLSATARLAVWITQRVGTMGFFGIIFVWTALWLGWNFLAPPALRFDPPMGFVFWLFISNVIQILLMPLIMVGQNVQSRHSDIRAELDYQVNMQAEKEVTLMLRHMAHNTDLLVHLMRHMDCRISEEEMRAISSEQKLAEKLARVDPSKDAVAPVTK